jgi:MFS family permease
MEWQAARSPLREHSRVLIASTLGTTVEYYDFQIYGLAAAQFFGPLFFPVRSPAAQTLLALMSFGIAFFARPVGAIVFGHFGDKVGRKSTLVTSLLIMGGCTLAIAFLPTYAMVGWLGPALLCLMRFGQGFGLGGEWAGAALLAVEYAPPGWKARFGAAPPTGATLGFFCATGVYLFLVLRLSPEDLMAWGWRIPFLVSAVLVAIGLWVRLHIAETPEFRSANERQTPPRIPAVEMLSQYPWAVLAGCAGVVCMFTLVYLNTTYSLARGTGALGYDRTTFLVILLFATVLACASGILAAIWADRSSPSHPLVFAAVASVFAGLVWGIGLESGSLAMAALTILAASLVVGCCNSPLGGWLASLYPVRVRYSGVALAINLGSIVGGAMMPVIAQVMGASGAGHLVGLLMSVSGILSLIAVKLAPSANGLQVTSKVLPAPVSSLEG